MKVIIEVELKEGQQVPRPEDIARLTNPEWLASWWHISDVHLQANGGDDDEPEEITDEEAKEVLRLLEKYHDSEVGINWEIIDSWIHHVKDQRKERA